MEFLLTGSSIVGMSGGGVYGRDGRHLGVLVRGSEKTLDGMQVIRLVRTTYIAAKLSRKRDGLSSAARGALDRFLEKP